jgi:phospholipase C
VSASAVALFLLAAVPSFAAVPISHIVVILQENHTFDNYFGKSGIGDGATTGVTSNGQIVPLIRPPLFITKDIDHSWDGCLLAMNNGAMDQFNELKGARQQGQLVNYSAFEQDQIPNYWAYAHQFVLGDMFFSSVHGPSFPNHLYSLAAWAGGAMNNPSSHKAWGCDAPAGTTVEVLDTSTGQTSRVAPCFDFEVLPDILDQNGVSWRYYGPGQGQSGYFWVVLDAIKHIRQGPDWKNVVSLNQLTADIANGNLRRYRGSRAIRIFQSIPNNQMLTQERSGLPG